MAKKKRHQRKTKKTNNGDKPQNQSGEEALSAVATGAFIRTPCTSNERATCKKKRKAKKKLPQHTSLNKRIVCEESLVHQATHGTPSSRRDLLNHIPTSNTQIQSDTMALFEYGILADYGAEPIYQPSKIKLPAPFELAGRKNWLSLPWENDVNAYMRRVCEERRKRKEPVLLPYVETDSNAYAKRRMEAAAAWLRKHNPQKYHVERSLLAWPLGCNRILKSPGLFSDTYAWNISNRYESRALANMNTPCDKVFSNFELRHMIISLLGHGDILSLRATCKLVFHVMTHEDMFYFNLNTGDELPGYASHDFQGKTKVLGEVVIGAIRGATLPNYAPLLENHQKIYKRVAEQNNAQLTHLTLQDVQFLNTDILRMVCNTLPMLARLKVLNCEHFDFKKLPDLIEILHETRTTQPNGDCLFKHLEFGPVYYEGPRYADREGSFGGFWNQFQGNFTKTLCSFLKEWYFPAKAVGLNILEPGTAFRHWVDCTPFRGDLTIVALHELLELVYFKCIQINRNSLQTWGPKQDAVICDAENHMLLARTIEEKDEAVDYATKQLQKWNEDFAQAKQCELEKVRAKFADYYFRILTTDEAAPLFISPQLVQALIMQNRPGRTHSAMMRQDSWQDSNLCRVCGTGRGSSMYSRMTTSDGFVYQESGQLAERSDPNENITKYAVATLVVPSSVRRKDWLEIADTITAVSKLRTDFGFGNPICFECVASFHTYSADAGHHNLDMKRDVIKAWTDGLMAEDTLLALVENSSGYDVAQQHVLALQKKRDHDRAHDFDTESMLQDYPHCIDTEERIRRKAFPHARRSGTRDEFQYRSIGTISQNLETSYLPDHFLTTFQLHPQKNYDVVLDQVQRMLSKKLDTEAQAMSLKLGLDRDHERVREEVPFIDYHATHPDVLYLVRAIMTKKRKHKLFAAPIKNAIDQQDRAAVSTARIEFGNARAAPNFVDGDWDQMRRDLMGYKDTPDEQAQKISQWNTTRHHGGTAHATGVIHYDVHASKAW